MKHVKFHLNRFLRRVRIHGGEFDTSARAMYRDEVVYPLQAELRIVRRSTIERKQMSTKTTFKRIALVTVAALGFGVMSVVPSNAMTQADVLTVSSATGTMLTGETATGVSTTLSFLNTNEADTLSVTAYLTAAPVGNTAIPVLALSETTSAIVRAAVGAGAPIHVEDDPIGQVAFVTGFGNAPSAASAKFNIQLEKAGATKTAAVLAGTYSVTLAVTVIGGGGVKNSINQVVTITVGTNPVLDKVAASATSYLRTLSDTTTAADAVITISKTVPASNEAQAVIITSLLNAAGTAADESYTAVITSGPGILGSKTQVVGTTFTNTAPKGRAITVKKGDYVTVHPDGASGVSTIQIQSALGVVLATKTVTFYGSAVKWTTSVVKSVIGVGANAAALLVSGVDSSGTQISNVTSLYVTSDATTKIAGARTVATPVAWSATNGLLLAPGYLVPLTGVAVGTANVTVGTCSVAPTAASTCIDASNSVSVRVGSTTPASVAVTLDKSSYIPGEKATITVSLLDKNGLTLADRSGAGYTNIFATGGITASYSLGAGSDTTTATSVHAYAAGKTTFTVYMPVAETDVKFSWTTGSVTGADGTGLALANLAKAGSVTVSVASSSGTAATAAAEEALAAASDAFDAALTAAEAAEMAQSIAQEALDSVASLRKRMNNRFNAIEKLIKRLL